MIGRASIRMRTADLRASPPPCGGRGMPPTMGVGGQPAMISHPPPHPLPPPRGGRDVPRPDRPTKFRRPIRIEPTKEDPRT
jgi:hypothetical protein